MPVHTLSELNNSRTTSRLYASTHAETQQTKTTEIAASALSFIAMLYQIAQAFLSVFVAGSYTFKGDPLTGKKELDNAYDYWTKCLGSGNDCFTRLTKIFSFHFTSGTQS